MGSFILTNPKVAKFQLATTETKSTHRELFEQLAATPDDTVPIKKTLLIWCTPRCGSTLFTEALNNSGRLGFCEEWFNNLYFKAWAEVMGCNFDLMRYWDFIKRKSTRGTGVFTVKWHVGQFIAMHEDFDLSESTLVFDHVIYLYRRDKIAQAVSFCRACSSDQFRSYEPTKSEPATTPKGIIKALEVIIRNDQFIQECLMHIVDKMYAYEDFQQLDTPTTRAHCSYNDTLYALGKEHYRNFHITGLEIQRDHKSEQVTKAFRNFLTGECHDLKTAWEGCWSGVEIPRPGADTPQPGDRDGSSGAPFEGDLLPG